jgi:hypothetical protein
MDIISSLTIRTFSTSEGVFDNGPISSLEAMPPRCLLPDFGNGPEDFVAHDDRKRTRRSACFSFIHPYVRTANTNHLNSEQAFLRTDLRERKLL